MVTDLKGALVRGKKKNWKYLKKCDFTTISRVGWVTERKIFDRESSRVFIGFAL